MNKHSLSASKAIYFLCRTEEEVPNSTAHSSSPCSHPQQVYSDPFSSTHVLHLLNLTLNYSIPERYVKFYFSRAPSQDVPFQANYHIDSANPTAHWPSFNSGTQQKHFPKSMSLIAASPLSPRWFKTHWGEGWSGAWQATLPTLVLFAPARCSPSVLQRVRVSLC